MADSEACRVGTSLSACILAALSNRGDDELMYALVRREQRGGVLAAPADTEASKPSRCPAASVVVDSVTKRVWCAFAALLVERLVRADASTSEAEGTSSVSQPVPHTTLVCDVGLWCRETFYACLVESVCLCLGKSFCLFRPDDPPMRLARLEKRRQPRCKLDTEDVAALLRDATAAAAQESRADFPVAVVPDDAVAYYMYTSGSTGDPKCVVASRRNLRAYLQGFILDRAGLAASDSHCRFFCLSSPFFDPSIGDMLVALCTAHSTFYTCTADDVLNGEAAALLASVQPTHVVSTPAVWLSLTSAGKLRSRLAVDTATRMKVFLGGERVSQELIDAWAGDVELHNIYGVTEVTIYQSVRRVLPGAAAAAVTCGPGVGATTIRIRDASAGVDADDHVGEGKDSGVDEQPLQRSHTEARAGVGEVVLYGEQVCCGYAEEEGEAADAPSPFGRDPVTGERFFATGDVGRMVQGRAGAPPQLELCGRRDWQMKVNGQRVGLEEVEGTVQRAFAGLASPCACFPVRPAVPGAAASIGAAAVLADVVRADLLHEHHDGVVAAFQELLALHLPGFMIPRRWLLLPRGAALPQTPTGKVSRTQLALTAKTDITETLPTETHTQEAGEASALRQVVQAAWQTTLGVPVRPDTHYVHAGGDSLGALKLTRAVYVGLHGGSDAGIDEHGGLPFPFQPCVLLQHPRFEDYVQALRDGWSTASQGSEGLPPASFQSPAAASSMLPHLSPAEAHADHLFRAVVAVRSAAVAECLLRHGLVQVNGHNTREHRCITALHIAVASSGVGPGQAEEDEAAVLGVVEVLLRYGARLTAVTPDGVTPAHVAAAGAPVAVLQRLLDHDGAAAHCRDRRQQSLLHFAARAGRPEAVSLLLTRYGLSLEVRDKWQRTPVHWSVLNGHVAVLQAMAAHVACEANDGESTASGVKRRRGAGGETARFTRLARKKTYLAYETLHEMARRVYPADDEVRQLCDALAPYIGEAQVAPP